MISILAFVFSNVNAQWDSLNLSGIDTIIVSQKNINNKTIEITQDLVLWSECELFKKINKQKENIPFSFNDVNSLIYFDDKSLIKGDTIYFQFRKFQDILSDTISRSFIAGIDNEVSYIALDIPKNNQNTSLLPEGLNYSGSFGRGLTAGNSQSLVLNSNFNMQLGGKIGDNIDLRAVISDANIPIQAEGTTQQLQEFDQVFIELKKDEQKLIAGDFRLNRPSSYFINYSKKLKGIKYTNQSIYKNKGNLAINGSFSISGGKFNRQKLNIQEGNQGPYKLQGGDNEQFIIVQSGTEKVYIDGELLIRGETNDYIILYDRAEIIFTEKRLIQNDFNVVVEFEYLVQNYARTIRNADAEWAYKKNIFQFYSYVESDSKNSSGIFDLSLSDKEVLSTTGDSNDAFQSGIFINEEFNSSSVYYQLETSGQADTILTYSTDSLVAIYQANFTDLGEGNGDYSIDDEVNANGRVYKYVGPGNGRYKPVKRLIAPETKQMYGFSHQLKYSKKGEINTEVSLSNFDNNLFSSIDDTDNIGYGIKSNWNQKWDISKKSSLRTSVFGELINSTFNFVNPYRSTEFTIDWNLPNLEITTSERLGGGILSYAYGSKTGLFRNIDLNYSSKFYNRTNNFNGNLQAVNGSIQTKSIRFDSRTSYLQSESTTFNSTFFRPNFTLTKKWAKLKDLQTGVLYDAEKNIQKDASLDTILNTSNTYDEIKFFVKNQDSTALQTEFFYSKRRDQLGTNGEIKDFSFADKAGVNITATGKNQRINFTVNYRVLDTDESFNNSVQDAENLLGGIDYQYNLWDNLVRGVSNVNFNSGQEPKLEFDYREVALGEGNYIWVDNGDNIQTQNEFQIAPFSDQGNFIRVSLFNNEFEQVYKQDFSQSLLINPIKWKLSEKKWKKKIANLSSQTNIRLSRKDKQAGGIPAFNFIDIDPLEENLVSYISSINQSIFWNRGNPSYDVQFNYLRNNSGILLTTGTDIRESENYILKFRKNFAKKLDVSVTGNRGFRAQNNLNFPQNNYNLGSLKGDLALSYRIQNSIEARINSSYVYKQNTLNIEKANSIETNIGMSYSTKNRTRIDGRITYNNIKYVTAQNALIDLVFLEGLQVGNNFLWEVRFTKRLINNFDLTLNYNGRKTGEARIVHVGNAQIRASF